MNDVLDGIRVVFFVGFMNPNEFGRKSFDSR